MSWSKRQVIVAAIQEAGMGADNFSPTPELLESARRMMDAMMATLYGGGLALRYYLPSNQDDSDLDQPSNLPDWAVEAVYLNLGLRLMGGFGRAVPESLKTARSTADQAVHMRLLGLPGSKQMPSTTPRGAGNRSYGAGRNYVSAPEKALDSGGSGDIDITITGETS